MGVAMKTQRYTCIGDGRSCGVVHRSEEAARAHLATLRQMYCQRCGKRHGGFSWTPKGHRNDVCAAQWYNGRVEEA